MYIGQTRRPNPFLRWKEHYNDLIKNKHPNNHLQSSFNKYGDGCFEFTLLSEHIIDHRHLDKIKKSLDDDYIINHIQDNLDYEEIKAISFYDSFINGFNQTIGGRGRIDKYCFNYTISKSGIEKNGKQRFCIKNKDNKTIIRSIDYNRLLFFVKLLNKDESAGMRTIKDSKQFRYSVSKNGRSLNGQQNFTILGRDHKPLIFSRDYNKLLELVKLLNESEEIGLKAICKIKEFKYTIAKAGFNKHGKQVFTIYDKNNNGLIRSIDYNFIRFVLNKIKEDNSLVCYQNKKYYIPKETKRNLKTMWKNQ